MNYGQLFRTVRHLKPTQVFYQLRCRLVKPTYKALVAPDIDIPRWKAKPIVKYKCCEGNRFVFLNLKSEFAGWSLTGNGMLWAYNQNYMDWLGQDGITEEEGCKWIDKFIEELPNNRVGLDPYPIALRSINWVKFFCSYPETATKTRLDSLYSQVMLLEKKLEYHLLANHLLEDAYALYICAIFFNDSRLLKKAEKLLLSQLEEQLLPDGAHYEQSPMYHCILLDRLLDCININQGEWGHHTSYVLHLTSFASRMLGHLESIVWKDGMIPLLNDSAYGIAPTVEQLFDYARRLGIEWKPIPMKACGYRKLKLGRMEAIVDVGNITATYQPGHTHADTFNYESRIDGKPFVVDTGISTYDKNERRQLERSTVAHNTVSVERRDTSEVWGGFRIGRRCHTEITDDTEKTIVASHNGFVKTCRRRFEMTDEGLVVEDWYDGEAVSYVHLAEDADAERVCVEGASTIDMKPWEYSTEYNWFHEGKVMEIHFNGYLKYLIR